MNAWYGLLKAMYVYSRRYKEINRDLRNYTYTTRHPRPDNFADWMHEVRAFLSEFKMSFADWQEAYPYDFQASFDRGLQVWEAADEAHRFWTFSQNEYFHRRCQKLEGCIYKAGHAGKCLSI